MKIRNRNRALTLNAFLSLALLGAFVWTGCGSRNQETINAEGPRSFSSHQIRYMTPYDLMQLLKTTFPVADLNPIDENCTQLTDKNRALVGDNSPLTGSPVFDAPSSGFVRWYVGCLNTYIAQYREQNASDPEVFYGSSLGRVMASGARSPSDVFMALQPDLRKAVVLEVIGKMLGPDEIIADFGYFGGGNEMAEHILQNLDIHAPIDEALKQIHFLVGIRDEFLSY